MEPSDNPYKVDHANIQYFKDRDNLYTVIISLGLITTVFILPKFKKYFKL